MNTSSFFLFSTNTYSVITAYAIPEKYLKRTRKYMPRHIPSGIEKPLEPPSKYHYKNEFKS